MQIVRFLIFLFCVFVLFFLAALLLPSKVTIAKTVEINATPREVSKQIIDFGQWKNWYPAFKDDHITVIKNLSYPLWVSLEDNQGKKVELHIIEAKPGLIGIDVKSSSSTKVNYLFRILPKMNNQTQVTWYVNTDMGWLPWKRIQGIFLDKFSGDQYQAALGNLKKAAEN